MMCMSFCSTAAICLIEYLLAVDKNPRYDAPYIFNTITWMRKLEEHFNVRPCMWFTWLTHRERRQIALWRAKQKPKKWSLLQHVSSVCLHVHDKKNGTDPWMFGVINSNIQTLSPQQMHCKNKINKKISFVYVHEGAVLWHTSWEIQNLSKIMQWLLLLPNSFGNAKLIQK